MASALKGRLPDLVEVIDQPGLKLLAGRTMPRLVSDDGSVALIGTFFPSQEDRAEAILPPLAGLDARAAADHVLKHGWGRYVLFCCGDVGTSGYLRDPTGAQRVYAWRLGNIVIVASDLPRALLDVVGKTPAINWSALGQLMARPEVAASHSALHDVEIPVPGVLHFCSNGSNQQTPLWTPARVATDREADITALPKMMQHVMGHWTRGHRRIAVELSGGLDSSLVLGCLASLPDRPQLCALNIVPHSPGGDERSYARAAAQLWGVGLIEVKVDPGELDYRELLARPRSPQPTIYGMDVVADRLSAQVAESFDASLIMTGQGGDALLFQPRSPVIAADYYARHGLDQHFLSLVRACALATNRSIWSVLAQAMGKPREQGRRAMPPSLAGPIARSSWEAGTLLHPWVAEAASLPPGKHLQIAMLANCQLFHGPTQTATSGRLVHPMLSQPLTELCLRLPVWQLVPDRRERGLARDLFAEILPQSVRERKGKGEASGFYNRVIAEHLETLRPLLLDGLLVEHGLVLPDPLRALLDVDHLLWRDDHPIIGTLIVLELWARQWSA